MALNIYIKLGLGHLFYFQAALFLKEERRAKGDQPKIDAETAAEDNYSGIIK